MKRVLFSIVGSVILSLFAGISLQYCLMEFPSHQHVEISLLNPIIWSAHIYSLLINLLFFYIRRWDGCIEKLGGATFTFFVIVATVIPVLCMKELADAPIRHLMEQYTFVVGVQIAVIGLIATHMLRTKNFNPPKPGEPWRW